jgi:hypothetical protein
LVGLIIVLGVLTVAGAGASAGAAINSTIQRDRAINQLNAAITRHNGAVATEQQAAGQVRNAISQVTAANSKLNSKVNSVIDQSDASCATVGCFNSADATAATDVGAFGRALRAVSFPAGTAAAANKLAAAATADSQAWEYMSQAVSLTDGVNRATRAEKAGKRFDDAFAGLIKALNQEVAAQKQRAAALNTEAAALSHRAAVLNVPVKVLTPGTASSPAVA